MPAPRKRELVRLYVTQHLSLKEVGRLYGVSRETVRRWLILRGIDRRDHSAMQNIAAQKASHAGMHGREQNPNWVGGRTVKPSGYVWVRCPDHPNANSNGYVAEHRLVMEQMLGRCLRSDEVVHHKNRNPGDNRPENLQLMQRGEHARHHICGLKRSEEVRRNNSIASKLFHQKYRIVYVPREVDAG